MAINKSVLYLTSAIKIQTVLDKPNPDSVKIEIEDSSAIVKINYVDMTKLADNVYQYIWQSLSTDSEGQYKVTIKAMWGTYTSTEISYFEMEAID